MRFNIDEQTLSQLGFSTDEIARLRLLREDFQRDRLHEQTLESRRLEFTRWLYLQGRLGEDIVNT